MGNVFSSSSEKSASTPDRTVGHKNMLQLIHLRWIAVLGQTFAIVVVVFSFDIRLPLLHMLGVLACLIAFNIGSYIYWCDRLFVTNRELFLALLVDVAMLTVQLYFSGGATNPFVFLYLLQIIISAVLLEAWSTWSIVCITSLCFAGLSQFFIPLSLTLDRGAGLFSMYVEGMLFCFIMVAILLVTFIKRISSSHRVADAQLATLRQRAAEEDYIVRMGLLASGAAHELGTPLATLSVILGDWRRMPEFSSNPVLLEEINEMQMQLQRCKAIVSNVLLSAEARGESSLNAFLRDVMEEFRTTRPIVSFEYDNRIKQDIPIVFDSILKQMIYNVLDNALEVSPYWLCLTAVCENDELRLTVDDIGPGFGASMLVQLGKPYLSTKGKIGGGLGLFFVVNAARKLNGTVTARNREENGCIIGATVCLTLPLSSISLEADALPLEEAQKNTAEQGKGNRQYVNGTPAVDY